MTKGGVMIGSTVSSRIARFAGKAVRVTISAKQSPRIVAAVAVEVASASVFQKTPQFTGPARQERPQILRSNSRSAMAAPTPRSPRGVNIWDSIVSTGQAVKMIMDATSIPTAPATKRSPLNSPRSASPSVSITRQPMKARLPPRPMPNCRSPSSPKRASSQG